MTFIRVFRRHAIPALLAVTALLTEQGALAVTGVVLDSSTRNPLAGAIITTSAGVTRTDEHGDRKSVV